MNKEDWYWVGFFLLFSTLIGGVAIYAGKVEIKDHAACHERGEILIKTGSGHYCVDPKIMTRP